MARKRPDWVLKLLKELKETLNIKVEARYINGNWYAYEVNSKWDKERKRPVKKTIYLGKLKSGKFIPKKQKEEQSENNVSCNEAPNMLYFKYYHWGNSALGWSAIGWLREYLEQAFGSYSDSILAIALVWGLYGRVPLRRISYYWEQLWHSNELKANLHPSNIAKMLREIGRRPLARHWIFGLFMEEQEEHVNIFDLTHIFVDSEYLSCAEYGYNSERKYHKQIKLGIMTDSNKVIGIDAYDGNKHEIKVLKEIAKIWSDKPVIWVGDRGFSSVKLAEELHRKGYSFIIPLRKNFSIIDYSLELSKNFKYKDRIIRYGRKEISRGLYLYLFHDAKLEGEQKSNIWRRWYEKEITDEELPKYEQRCGKIAILTNTKLSGEEVYSTYKQRQEAEVIIDALKNELNLDRTWMRDDSSLRGWWFIASLSLQVYYYVLKRLRSANLVGQWSVKDVIMVLSRILKVPTNDGWVITMPPKKILTLIEKLDIQKQIGLNMYV